MRIEPRTSLDGRAGFAVRSGPLSVNIETRSAIVIACLLLLSAAIAVVAMTIGRIPLSPLDVLAILTGHGPGGSAEQVVLNVRLPRMLTGLFVGAALGASGAVIQSISRNALGSPDIIGFTMGSASGALAQIVIFGGTGLAISMSAIGGGLITSMLVYILSIKGGVTSSYRLVLIGIGVGAIMTALIGLMLVKGDLDDAIAANLWLAGSLNARTWLHAWPVLIGAVLLIPILAGLSRALSLMEMGDDVARQLGVNVETTRIAAMVVAVLLASLATGSAGPIAFVALAAPQLVRRLIGHGQLSIIGSAAMGALLLILADLVSQLAPFGIVVPIGRMTGLVGGLYLVWLLTRAKRL